MQAVAEELLHTGDTLRLTALCGGFVELCFDRKGGSVNMFDQKTVAELDAARARLESLAWLRGVLITSAKEVFIVGADITEFTSIFALPHAALMEYLRRSNDVFIRFEALEVPTVAAINGFALGGGLEFALASSFRVMAQGAQAGLPEVGLGLLPGFGGTVRLPRIAGLEVAIEWIALGKPHDAQSARACDVVDRVCTPQSLREQALLLLHEAADSQEWRRRRKVKSEVVPSSPGALRSLVEGAGAAHRSDSSRHLPAALAGIELLGRTAAFDSARAQLAEAETFAALAKSQAAASLIRIFLNNQSVRKRGRGRTAATPESVAVVGAAAGGGAAMEAIQGGGGASLGECDLVVECGTGDLGAKQAALLSLERAVKPQTVLLTRTAGLRVTDLGAVLARPENLIGFHALGLEGTSLMELAPGPRTSPGAVARATAYATAIGTTPLVVADSPGFVVMRVFMALVRACAQLGLQGAGSEQMDCAMAAAGWAMGPAALQDTIGRDALLLRAAEAIAGDVRHAGAPDTRVASPRSGGERGFTDEEIVDGLMLAMTIEAARVLEQGVVATAAEIDMAMVLGLGFPRHLGGPLQYADWQGLQRLAALAERYRAFGPAWELTPSMREMTHAGKGFYTTG